MIDNKFVALAAAAGLSLLAAGAVRAQEAAAAPSAGAPPSWDTLVRCAQMAVEESRLACYDAAMRAAGYSPKPEEVAAEHRKRFGLSIPQINVLKHHGKEEGAQAAEGSGGSAQAAAPAKGKPAPAIEEDEDQATVTLTQVATIKPDDRLLMFTADGAIWEQVDADLVSPLPKEGQTVRIHKGKFGGYFCDVNKYKSVRCKRDR